ncbi:MAG TPA: DUF4336 domain-containing protein [Gammaproteobacteria bacterium]|nr:DUF4336 domain-containing protein [Gammaproteobacteria bacterium]
MTSLQLYQPINELKPVANDIWIVDGPEVRMQYWGLRLPFTTRMTIVRLPDGRIWIHSPTELTEELRQAVAALGPVSFIVSPNRLHTSWLATWKAQWPEAVTAGVAREPAWNGTRMNYGIDLSDDRSFPWQVAISQCFVQGSVFSETIFFHAASRTLILTDLVENFELERVRGFWMRLLLRIAGPLDPGGTAPSDMRYTFRKHRAELRAAVGQIRGWAPDRVILSHGRWYQGDGLREMERAFAWVW